MMLLFRVFVLAFLFWFLQPSYEAIYHYHFGAVTNSDALYPYLFIKDFEISTAFASGWVTPPSHCLFPDLILIYLLSIFTSDIFYIHFGFAFFCFLSVIYLLRALGFSRSIALVGALCFLRLGEYYPQSWGQFFLPSFHGTEFFLLGLCLRVLRRENHFSLYKYLLLGGILGLSIYSELWFIVHSFLPLLILILSNSEWKPKKLVLTTVTGISVYLSLIQLQKKIGIGSFQPKQFPIIENLKNAYAIFLDKPLDFIGDLLSQTSSVPLSELLLPTFLVLFFVTLLPNSKSSKDWRLWTAPFGFVLSVVFLKLNHIEPNARYFYFLPLSCLSLFFYQVTVSPKWIKSIVYLALLVLIFVSHRFWQNEATQHQNLVRKMQHEERLECTKATLAEWGSNPGVSGYWPVKYLRTFSGGLIHLVPFTPEGVYYPWVHNLNWDKDIEKKETSMFSWGITSPESELLFGKKGIESKICGDWKLIRISK